MSITIVETPNAALREPGGALPATARPGESPSPDFAQVFNHSLPMPERAADGELPPPSGAGQLALAMTSAATLPEAVPSAVPPSDAEPEDPESPEVLNLLAPIALPAMNPAVPPAAGMLPTPLRGAGPTGADWLQAHSPPQPEMSPGSAVRPTGVEREAIMLPMDLAAHRDQPLRPRLDVELAAPASGLTPEATGLSWRGAAAGPGAITLSVEPVMEPVTEAASDPAGEPAAAPLTETGADRRDPGLVPARAQPATAPTEGSLGSDDLPPPSDETRELAARLGVALGRRLVGEIARGNWQMKLKLNPGTLGQIEVRLQMRGGELDAAFVATQAQTRELLGEGMGRLRETLTSMGMNVANLDVADGRSFQHGGGSTPRPPAHWQRAAPAGADPSPPSATTPLLPATGSQGLDVIV